MRRQRYSGRDTQRVLVGMITSARVARRVASIWDGRLFGESRWANLVGKWAVDHFRKFEQPLNLAIRSTFENWAVDRKREEVEPVERFIDSFDDIVEEQLGSSVVLDIATKLFERNRMKHLATTLGESLELSNGHAEEGARMFTEAINEYRRIAIADTGSIDWSYADFATIDEEEDHDIVVTYPGDFGHLIGSDFSRDCFVGYMAPDKTGKSFFLLDAVIQAMRQNRRVAYFVVGDLSEKQVRKRVLARLARRPLRAQAVKVPTLVEDEIEFDTSRREQANPSEAWRRFERLTKRKKLWRLFVRSAGSITIQEIRTLLETEELESGWLPDVVVIDYADILARSSGYQNDKIGAIDEIWMSMRAMSSDLHCLVLTATQSNAKAYSKKGRPLHRDNFSDAKQKLAHVTGMLGIQTDPSDSKSVLVNWIVRREDEFSENRQVRVVGCLSLSRPIIVSQYLQGVQKNESQ
jgi:hypothetical protein